jgi:hypothetical protein
MKYLIALLLAVSLVGCYTVKPGADPVVVHAEQLALQATETIDDFITLVDRNPGGVSDNVVAARNLAAESGPVYIRHLRTLTRTYKASRNEADKTELQAGIDAIEQLLEIIKQNAK